MSDPAALRRRFFCSYEVLVLSVVVIGAFVVVLVVPSILTKGIAIDSGARVTSMRSGILVPDCTGAVIVNCNAPF